MYGPVAPLYLTPPPVTGPGDDDDFADGLPGSGANAAQRADPSAPRPRHVRQTGASRPANPATTAPLRTGATAAARRRSDPPAPAARRPSRALIAPGQNGRAGTAARHTGTTPESPDRYDSTTRAPRHTGPAATGPARAVAGPSERDEPGLARGDGLAAEAPAGTTGIKRAGLTADGRPRARATVNRRQRPAAASTGQPSPSTAGPANLPENLDSRPARMTDSRPARMTDSRPAATSGTRPAVTTGEQPAGNTIPEDDTAATYEQVAAPDEQAMTLGQVMRPRDQPVEGWDTAAALRNDVTTELPIITDRRRSSSREVTVDLAKKYGLPKPPVQKTAAARRTPAPEQPQRPTVARPTPAPTPIPIPTAEHRTNGARGARRDQVAPDARKPSAPPAWPRQATAPGRPAGPVDQRQTPAVRDGSPTGGRVTPKSARKKKSPAERISLPLQFRPIVSVTDMSASVTFFEQLGAEVIHGRPGSDYVLMQVGLVQLGLVCEHSVAAQTAVELNFATTYPLAELEQHLRTQDVPVAERVHDTDFGPQLHLRTPDGLVIRITQLDPAPARWLAVP
jgi:hypothetical protein